MDYRLTSETIKQIKNVAEEIMKQAKDGKLSGSLQADKEELEKIHKKNKEAGFDLVHTCYFGPESMQGLLIGTELQDILLSEDSTWQVYYTMAMEKVLGMSTRMQYEKEKNKFLAYTPTKKDEGARGKILFDPKDVELGFWDKVCAAFGYTTSHAQKVAFAKESIKVQNKQLDGLNKSLALSKKNEFMKKHKDFADHNQKIVMEFEKTEKGFKELFFGDDLVPDYTFKSGLKMSALTACIGMYHKESIQGKDIAKMTLEEINQPENQELRNKLRAIGDEYKKLTGKEARVRNQQFQYVDQFLFEKNEKYSLMDKSLLARMETKSPFIIGFDKLKEQKDVKAYKFDGHRNEMIGAKAFVMYKAKVELSRVFEDALGKEATVGYQLFDKESRENNKQYFGAFREARENHMFMLDMGGQRYQDTWKYLEKLNDGWNKLLGIQGLRKGDYSDFIADADTLIEHKELLSGIMTLHSKESQKNDKEKDNIISQKEPVIEEDMEMGGRF